MSKMQITLDAINAIQNKMAIVDNDAVREQFIRVYDTIWGEGTGEAAYLKESRYFKQQLGDKPDLMKATSFSIYAAFLDMAVNGLSLEPGARALCYLQGRNYKTTDSQGREAWEGRVAVTISGYGELVSRARAGQIRYADNPVLVYENDEFSFSETNGQKKVNYTCHLPHAGKKIVACYLKITRNDGSMDYAVMYEEDWRRLEGFSAKNNKSVYNKQTNTWESKPNALYLSNNGTIDPGFLCAKCIKHAFRTYPKLRIGKATMLESDTVEQAAEIDYYGIGEQPEPGQTQEQPAMPVDQNPPYGGPRNDLGQGVKVDPEDDDTF